MPDLVRQRMALALDVGVRVVERVEVVEGDAGVLGVDDAPELALVADERLVVLAR